MNIEKIVANCLQRRRAHSHNEHTNPKQTQCSKQLPPSPFSFQPSINQLPQSLYKATTKTQCSRQQIIQRLYTDRRSQEGRRTHQKLKEDQKQYLENCTFQPSVNQYSKKIVKTECEDEDAFERLYSDALSKKKLYDSTYLLDHNKQNYSFQPQTHYKKILNTQSCNMKPIYQRIEQILQKKRQNLKQLQEQVTNKQVQPQPKINETSEKLLSNKQEFKKNIIERLTGYIHEQRQKKQKQCQQYELNLLKQCTFKPEINNIVDISTNFISRQQQFVKKLQSKMNSRIVYNNFQPEINKISQILVREQRANQSIEDKINRLTNDTNKRQKIDQIQKQLYQQCTFQPQINLISKCLAAQHVPHRCQHLNHKQQDFEFKPKINKISQLLAKNSKDRRQHSASMVELRKQNMQKIKMQNEYKQLKQCTFKPKINMGRSKPATNLSDIPGYESFIKKIDKIQQLKDDERERQKKVFNLQQKYKNRKSTTPIEFKLSHGFNNKETIKQEVREKFLKQCTFQPIVNAIR